jgi:excinuclease ABC subunit A
VVVSGVSGSGKSSLINDILAKELQARLMRANTVPGRHDDIEGIKELDKAIIIDQSPIGRTPRSNPATYTGLFTPIRELFRPNAEAKLRGYSPAALALTSKAAAAKTAPATALSRSKCTFCRTFTCPAKSATASATTAKRWKSTTKAKPSATCWK